MEKPLFLTIVDEESLYRVSSSMDECPVQDSIRFRSRMIAIKVATAIVDDQGNILWEKVKILREELSSNPFLINFSSDDFFILKHLSHALGQLIIQPALQNLLNRFSLPLCHQGAEELIRYTLWPINHTKLQIADLKRAVLCAWLTWLRQISGSCFATAPAILIQQEQPLQFLKDILELLTKGFLQRMIEGKEYKIPLCPSKDFGDLWKPFVSSLDKKALFRSPGFKAAFNAAEMAEKEFLYWEDQTKDPKTPRELIEDVLLVCLELTREEIQEEKSFEKSQMRSFFARQGAIYHPSLTGRGKKVALWRHKTNQALITYQALTECALLRAWEYTIASLCDLKADFGKWNLYLSLGIHPSHKGGLGFFLQSEIRETLHPIQEEIKRQEEELTKIKEVFEVLKSGGSATRVEQKRLRIELTAIDQKLTAKIEEETVLLRLLDSFVSFFDRLAPETFQEIFDPTLNHPSALVNNSPAGFHLAYKQGSSWILIDSEEAFIDSLKEFLVVIEQELIKQSMDYKVVIQDLFTKTIQYVQTKEFIQGTFERTSQETYRKPWEYASGGSVDSLVTAYVQKTLPLSFLEKKIRTEEELLLFLLEIKKQTSPNQKLLIQSPTHAFIGCLDEMDADPFLKVQKMKTFWGSVSLENQEWLVEQLAAQIPLEYRPLFLHRCKQQVPFKEISSFRVCLIDAFPEIKIDREKTVDRFLYSCFPQFTKEEALSLGKVILGKEIDLTSSSLFFTSIQLQNGLKKFADATDLDEIVATFLREKNLAPPAPILFADTNWPTGQLGFAVSPGQELKLWSFHRTCLEAIPMSDWFKEQEQGVWKIFHRPNEWLV